jgi:hypothetical protein
MIPARPATTRRSGAWRRRVADPTASFSLEATGRARRGLIVVTAAVLMVGAGCSGKEAGGKATAPSVTQGATGATGTTGQGAGAAPVRTGQPYEFTSEGFRYSFALAAVQARPEKPPPGGFGTAWVPAPPGKAYVAFAGLLVNLQQDRQAPFPRWAAGLPATDGEPVVTVPKSKVLPPGSAMQAYGDFACIAGSRCVYWGTYQCQRTTDVTDANSTVELVSSGDLLPPGETVFIGCFTGTEISEPRPGEIGVHYSANGKRHALDLPAP